MEPSEDLIRTGEHGVARGFGRGLFLVLLLATAVRVAFIVGFHRSFPLTGDAWVYHHEARFVANGRGFVDPVAWRFEQAVKQAADHPPLYIVALALLWLVGARSNISQMLLNGALGVVTVALVALLARRLVGDRGGLIAGTLAALYPGLWSWNGQIISETLSVLLAVAVVMVAYRYLEDRSVRRATLLALTIGLAALTRSELLALAVLIPALLVAHWRAGRGLAQLVGHGVAATVVLAAVLAPWTAYNLSRFEEPVLLGAGFGRALASGTCPETISGADTGFWYLECVETPRGVSKAEQRALDGSQLDRLYRDHAVDVMSENRERMPVVFVARVGRMFQFWAPLQQLRFDQLSESREWWVTGSSFSTFYLLAAGAVAGATVLLRRRVRLYPLLLPVGVAALGALLAFGTSRYRSPAEPFFVVLAAVGIDAVLRRRERRRYPAPADAAVEPDPDEGYGWSEAEADAWGPPTAFAADRWDTGGLRPIAGSGRTNVLEHHDEPAPEPDEFSTERRRTVSLPLVMTALVVVLVATGAAGAWVVQVTENVRPTLSPTVPAPSLPPG